MIGVIHAVGCVAGGRDNRRLAASARATRNAPAMSELTTKPAVRYGPASNVCTVARPWPALTAPYGGLNLL